jgi:hypothetical protein
MSKLIKFKPGDILYRKNFSLEKILILSISSDFFDANRVISFIKVLYLNELLYITYTSDFINEFYAK